MGRYINPYTDFGFKKLFGEESNKDILMDFLNELLREEEGEIVDLQYLKTEQLGIGAYERRSVYDLYCTNAKGEFFIVEMQQTRQQYFKDRTLYYSPFPIREQAERAERDLEKKRNKDTDLKETWNYEFKPVYMIGILNFIIDDHLSFPDKYKTVAKLSDIDTHHVFYDKMTYIFLEMPKFNKPLDVLENKFEKWLYLLKHLKTFDRMPDKLKESIFEKVFRIAEISNLSKDQQNQYQQSLKYLRDNYSIVETSFEEGKIEEKIEIVRKMKRNNIPIDIIIQCSNLSKEEIEKL